jgi:hypothetical protein
MSTSTNDGCANVGTPADEKENPAGQHHHADPGQDQAHRVESAVKDATVLGGLAEASHGDAGGGPTGGVVARVDARQQGTSNRQEPAERPEENDQALASHGADGTPKVTREALRAAYSQLLAGDVGQIAGALYNYGRRLVDERQAERDVAPSSSARGESSR